jgi:hypothetical protein
MVDSFSGRPLVLGVVAGTWRAGLEHFFAFLANIE